MPGTISGLFLFLEFAFDCDFLFAYERQLKAAGRKGAAGLSNSNIRKARVFIGEFYGRENICDNQFASGRLKVLPFGLAEIRTCGPGCNSIRVWELRKVVRAPISKKKILTSCPNSERPSSLCFWFSLILQLIRPSGLALLREKSRSYVLKNLKKISYLSFCVLFISFVSVSTGAAQERQRIVKTISSRPTNQPPTASVTTDKTKSLTSSIALNVPTTRPVLTNALVVQPPENKQPLVKKTVSSMAMNAAAASFAAGRVVYSGSVSSSIMRGIESRLGIPYRYGSTGPNRYDCSGFVWSVFNEAGIDFTRQSARSLWAISEAVTGNERFKFGTLVFLNGLGHMGIVADENGFYHASSSKGITYSPFKGYWENRIVGFRRLSTVAKEIVDTEALGK